MKWRRKYEIENKEQNTQLPGRRERETIISEDNILYLKILLNTGTDFDKLLKKL